MAPGGGRRKHASGIPLAQPRGGGPNPHARKLAQMNLKTASNLLSDNLSSDNLSSDNLSSNNLSSNNLSTDNLSTVNLHLGGHLGHLAHLSNFPTVRPTAPRVVQSCE